MNWPVRTLLCLLSVKYSRGFTGVQRSHQRATRTTRVPLSIVTGVGRDEYKNETETIARNPQLNQPRLIEFNGPEEQGKAPALKAREIVKFVAPTLCLWMAPPVMSLIDTSVVGRFCGSLELASLGPGCTLIDSTGYLFTFLATATTNLVATAQTNGDSADHIVSEALCLAAVFGAALGAVVLLAGEPLLGIIAGKASRGVVPLALKYASIRAWGQPAVILATVARASSLAVKDTVGPLRSVALAFLWNAIGTVVLVRGFRLGVIGAGLATVTADIAACVLLLSRIRRRRAAPTRKARLISVPGKENLKKFARYAGPVFFTILGKSVVYNGISLCVGRLGAKALAAHEVLLRSFFFWTPVGDSIGMTSQVFLPGIIAREKETGIQASGARRSLYASGVVAGCIAATMAGLLPTRGSFLFTSDTEVLGLLYKTAPILAASVGMHGIALTSEGMLLAQRDLRFLTGSYVTTTILTAAYLTSPWRPTSLSWLWGILAAFQVSRAVQFTARNLVLARRSSRMSS